MLSKTFIFSIILSLCSCYSTKTLSYAEYKNKTLIAASSTLGDMYYLGTDTSYHYFSAQYNIGNEYFKVKIQDLELNKTIPANKNPRVKWVHMPNKEGIYDLAEKDFQLEHKSIKEKFNL